MNRRGMRGFMVVVGGFGLFLGGRVGVNGGGNVFSFLRSSLGI